jgi:hypothetical protein
LGRESRFHQEIRLKALCFARQEKAMSKPFAWIMGVLSIVMLLLQLIAADRKMGVVGFWILVLALCIYVVFGKKPAKVS